MMPITIWFLRQLDSQHVKSSTFCFITSTIGKRGSSLLHMYATVELSSSIVWLKYTKCNWYYSAICIYFIIATLYTRTIIIIIIIYVLVKIMLQLSSKPGLFYCSFVMVVATFSPTLALELFMQPTFFSPCLISFIVFSVMDAQQLNLVRPLFVTSSSVSLYW